MDDDAPFEAFGHCAALVTGVVEGKARRGGRMQPLRLAADAQAGFIEAAHARGLG